MTIVLLHGIGGPSWGDLLPDAIHWPMPGFCGTPALPVMTFPALADALRETLDVNNVRQAILVGHSMGGMIAQEFYATFPHRVSKLALVATTPAFGGRDPAFAESFLKARLGPLDSGKTMAEAAEGMLAGMFDADAPPDAMPRAAAAMAAIPEAVYRDTLRCLTTFDRRADLPRIAVPTLLVAGDRDQTAPLKTMQRMAEAIPDARLVAIPRCGHLIPLERPAEFRAALLPFLAD